MKRLRFSIIVISLLLSNFCHGQKVIYRYIDRFSPIAQNLSTEFGIPVSIILGVSIHESGSGTSINAKQLNNYFGVVGRNTLKKRRSVYKQYAKPEDSFRDFCEIISRKKFYPGLKNNVNYSKWLGAMNHASYASAKNEWVDKSTQIIRKYKLDKFDKE